MQAIHMVRVISLLYLEYIEKAYNHSVVRKHEIGDDSINILKNVCKV